MAEDEPRFDLLVIGDAVPDVVVVGVPSELVYRQMEHLVDDAVLTVGGSAAILACGAARLGMKVAFVGALGDDTAGHFMAGQLAQRGVDTRGLVIRREWATGLTVNLVRATDLDRTLLTFSGAVSELEPSMIDDELLLAARHVHVGSFYLLPKLAPALPELFAKAQAAGLTTSIDTQGDSTQRWQGGLREALRYTDYYFPNEDEALGAAHASDLMSALTVLAAYGTIPVVKRGAAGAVAYTGCNIVQAPALALQPVDTVGAGDTFDAAFLYGRLHRFSVAKSLALATACGSLSTRARGGVEAQPTLAEALQAAGTITPSAEESSLADGASCIE